jgi:DNA-binding NtrC family response regulator
MGEVDLSLLVIREDGETQRIALADKTELSVGRSSEAGVAVDDAHMSNVHAVLRIGAQITICDLDSTNGTWVRDQTIKPNKPVEIRVGDLVRCGSTLMILQPAAGHVRPRRLWMHGYFEARLEDECARATRDGRTFALVRVRFDDAEQAQPIERILGATLRPADVVAKYAECDYELLLIDAGRAESEEVLRRLSAQLTEKGYRTHLGVACYPQDGRTPEELVAKTSAVVLREDDGDEADWIVEGPSMQRLRPVVERIAQGTINVLILGETGVGKEVLAERIHALSPRAREPLVRLNCAAFADTLLESELFGHERGAFTGAVTAKVGLLETANRGTVLLDEVGELPLPVQAKLLRVIDERRMLRVGGLKPRSIDVRFLAATNRDLELEIARGRFRLDLFFRLNGATLVLPPLRKRTEEIEELAQSFIRRSCRQMQRRRRPVLGAEALSLLKSYSWPGNIRELRNVIERAVLLCQTEEIGLEHLPTEKMGPTLSVPAPSRPSWLPRAPSGPRGQEEGTPTIRLKRAAAHEGELKSGDTTEEVGRIMGALEQCAGNQTRAAKLLGISRGTLVSRLETYSIARPRKNV